MTLEADLGRVQEEEWDSNCWVKWRVRYSEVVERKAPKQLTMKYAESGTKLLCEYLILSIRRLQAVLERDPMVGIYR